MSVNGRCSLGCEDYSNDPTSSKMACDGCVCPIGLVSYRDRCVDPRECYNLFQSESVLLKLADNLNCVYFKGNRTVILTLSPSQVPYGALLKYSLGKLFFTIYLYSIW